jgi:hypothetical protein
MSDRTETDGRKGRKNGIRMKNGRQQQKEEGGRMAGARSKVEGSHL